MIGQDRIRYDRMGLNRTGQDRMGWERTGQDRTGQKTIHTILDIMGHSWIE